jgi:uncharacterized protein
MTLFFENGLYFSCIRCSRCCRIEPGFVFLSQDDLTKLCVWFKFEEKVFIEKYCREVSWNDGVSLLCLREKENNDCILWDNGCIAYGARPVQCTTYPFWTRLTSDLESWSDERHNCPGIGRGRLWTKEEILEQVQLYASNHPVYIKK